MNGVSKITVTDDVALLTFHNIPNDWKILSQIFTGLADAQVNLDMISQTAPQGHQIDLSFTLRAGQLVEVLGLINRFKELHAGLFPMVSNGNCKIQLYGEEMRELYGVAARAISAVAGVGAELTMISTGEVEIALLVPQADCAEAVRALEEAFQVSADA